MREQTLWLRYAGLGVGVLVGTLATIGLIYLGVDYFLDPGEIASEVDPAPLSQLEPVRRPLEPAPPPRLAPEPAPLPRPVLEPAPPPPPEPPPPPPPEPKPEPPSPLPPPEPEPEPVPTPLRPAPATTPVDLLVIVVDAEENVLVDVALTLNPGAVSKETNELGHWLFEELSPGVYDITASRDGFFDHDQTVDLDDGLAEGVLREVTIVLEPTPVLDVDMLLAAWRQAKATAEQARADITLTLEEYGKAYVDKDVDVIQEVYPEAPIDAISEHFGETTYELYAFAPPEFTMLDIRAGTATVESTLERKFEARVGGEREGKDDREITFVRQENGGRWLISGWRILK